jgi:hypothetical protein
MVKKGKADVSWLCQNWPSMLATTDPTAGDSQPGDCGGLPSLPLQGFALAVGDWISMKVRISDVKLPIRSSVSYSYAQLLS